MNPSTGSTSSLIKTPIEFRSEPFRLRLYGAVETCDRPLFAFDIAVKLRDAAALLLDSVRQLVVIAHRLLVLRHVEMLAVAVHEPSLDAVCGCGLFQLAHHQVLQIGKALRMAFRFLLRVVRPERIAENRLVCLGNRNVANRDVADAQIGIDVPQVGAIGQVRVVPRVVGTG